MSLTDIALDDPRLDVFRDLKSAHHAASHCVVESELVLGRLLDLHIVPERVVLTPSRHARLAGRLAAVPEVFVLEKAQLQRLVGFDMHRGCLAWVRRPSRGPGAAMPRAGAVFVGLSGLADPANVGAMVRTSRALGAAGMFLHECADAFSRRAIRASMGHVFALPLWWCAPGEAVQRIKSSAAGRVQVVAAALGEHAVDVERAPLDRSAVKLLLIGNEGVGLSREEQAVADVLVRIPMAADVDSLNAGAALAVLLYRLARG